MLWLSRKAPQELQEAAFQEKPVGSPSLPSGSPPLFLRLRSSTFFVTFSVALGILTDLCCYGLVVPVVPFRLQALGYDAIGSKTGWLVAAYAAGLIVSSPPIAYVGEKVKGRRMPLIVALLFMAGALILFMETASFTAMVISRVLQGFSGTGIWSLGLALVTDSVPEKRVGEVMGYVMIGFSIGSLLGPPVDESLSFSRIELRLIQMISTRMLYARLGFRAPFVFALCLVFVDLVLRLVLIEKHTALRWIEAGVDIPGFEAPGYTPRSTAAADEAQLEPDSPQLSPEGRPPSVWKALLHMVTAPRPVTLFILTGLQGFILGGLLDTGMVLWLQQQYGLDSLGAGLVFIGAVVPTFFASPLAGMASDRWGAKWITVAGLLLSIPTYSLLIIKGPLPLFVFFLALLGFSLSFFLTPTMQDLALVVGRTPGLGAAHVYATFNMCYSIGCFVGPIVGGQIIEGTSIRKGWVILSSLSSGLALLLLPPVALFVGGPLQLQRGTKRSEASLGGIEAEEERKETS